jgi:hypothetical protein
MERIYPQGAIAPISSNLRKQYNLATREQGLEALETQQNVISIGEPIPIVFCDAGSTGGVWISPPAARIGYTNTCETVSSRHVVVLSDGQVPAPTAGDVWKGSRTASFTFAFSTAPGAIANGLIAQTYQKTESYVAATGASGVPVSKDSEGMSALTGTTEVVVESKSDQVVSWSASISTKYKVRGAGNGMDGCPAYIVGKTHSTNSAYDYAALASRLYTATASRTVSWQSSTTSVNSAVTGRKAYKTTFSSPSYLAASIYPQDRIFTSTVNQANIDSNLSTASTFARSWVNELSIRQYTAPRDAKYIGSGTTISVIEDQYTVTVTETTEYDCPLPKGVTHGGSGGSFQGLSTLTVTSSTASDQEDHYWQVHVYMRKGILVSKLLGGTGSSNLFPDLMLHLLRAVSRVPDALINIDELRAAATFCNANGLLFNGVVGTSNNLRDYLSQVAPLMLCRFLVNAGQYSLRPLLPSANGAISTAAVTPVVSFDEATLLPGALTVTYISLADRKPFCALMLWRQQASNKPGVLQTTEVRYSGSAVDGPYETYDMSEFCTSEAHAIKAGRYILAKRRHCLFSVQFSATVSSGAAMLSPGDVVRVNLNSLPSLGSAAAYGNLFEVTSVTEGLNGAVQIEADHFPVNGSGSSLYALTVLGSI